MALLVRGSTFTLYGGSVLTRWIVCAAEQPVHVLGLAAVAAEQPVVAQQDQFARLGDRLVGRLGNLVLDDLAAVAQPASSASCSSMAASASLSVSIPFRSASSWASSGSAIAASGSKVASTLSASLSSRSTTRTGT